MARLRFDSLLLGSLHALVVLTVAVPVLYGSVLGLVFLADRAGVPESTVAPVAGVLLCGSPLGLAFGGAWPLFLYQGLVLLVLLGIAIAAAGPAVRRLRRGGART